MRYNLKIWLQFLKNDSRHFKTTKRNNLRTWLNCYRRNFYTTGENIEQSKSAKNLVTFSYKGTYTF